jgi:hypothetical protein
MLFSNKKRTEFKLEMVVLIYNPSTQEAGVGWQIVNSRSGWAIEQA